jgi:hypothetical protein
MVEAIDIGIEIRSCDLQETESLTVCRGFAHVWPDLARMNSCMPDNQKADSL